MPSWNSDCHLSAGALNVITFSGGWGGSDQIGVIGESQTGACFYRGQYSHVTHDWEYSKVESI